MLSLGALALVLGQPLVFPAIGASALVLFSQPLQPVSTPRNVVLSHAIAATIGLACLALFGRGGVQGSLAHLGDWRFLASGALALGMTIGAMGLARVVQPPAGATTMIVGMGLLPKPQHALAIVASAMILCVEAYAALRMAGLRYPVWSQSADEAT